MARLLLQSRFVFLPHSEAERCLHRATNLLAEALAEQWITTARKEVALEVGKASDTIDREHACVEEEVKNLFEAPLHLREQR